MKSSRESKKIFDSLPTLNQNDYSWLALSGKLENGSVHQI